jgi:hypothetical protein
MERELHEKKKLSQENEELHYKIRQSFCLDGSQLSTRYMFDNIQIKPAIL